MWTGVDMNRHRSWGHCCARLGAGLIAASLAACPLAVLAQTGAKPLALMYYERPPYMIDMGDGRVAGISADASSKVMTEAGLAWNWHKMGSKRIIEIIQENTIPTCGIGWYKSADREAYAQFSKAIYQDKMEVGLASKKLALPAGMTLAKLLTTPSTRVLVKEGFTYGGVSALMKKYQTTQVTTSASIKQMLQMIQGNRADIMFLAQEELAWMFEQGGYRAGEFNIVHFPDMPPGNTRHFMCSKNVPASVMQKIDAAIHFTPH
jgi:hypothetical protein